MFCVLIHNWFFFVLTSLLSVKIIFRISECVKNFVYGIFSVGSLKFIFHLETHVNKTFQDHQIYSLTYFSLNPLFPFYAPSENVEWKGNIKLKWVKAVYARKVLSQFISFKVYIYWEILFNCIEAFFVHISSRCFKYFV